MVDMDDSEDSVSYKSADESESEEDFVDSVELTQSSLSSSEATQLCKSSLKSSLCSRPSTPYQLLPRRSTPKRLAPQPPSKQLLRPLPPLPNQSEGALPHTLEQKTCSDKTMKTFVPQLRSAVLNTSNDQVEPERVLLNLASHPVVIKAAEPHEPGLPPSSFSNLQIRLIDDESDLENETSSSTPTGAENFASLLPSDDAVTSSTFAIHNSYSPSLTSSGLQFNTSTVVTGNNTPTATYTTISPQGLGGMPFCTFPPFQNVPAFNNISAIYENVIPQRFAGNASSLAYLSPVASLPTPYIAAFNHPLSYPEPATANQSSSLALVPSPSPVIPASIPAILAPGVPAFGQELSSSPPRRNLALSHSASDPDISKRTKGAFLTSPSTYPELSRLSEGEEDDECREPQAMSSSQSWDYVKRDSRRLKRSDSVITVAHLYEDIFVSSRYKVKVTLTNLAVVVILAAFFVPNSAAILFNAFRLVFGTLFPAYYSYKAVRTKNIQEYVKWMMYWIVFAFFTCFETITDVLLSFWFPFYYELKILIVLWLLSPATKGSSILYRKFVHPWLTKREEEIDECISKAKQQGYSTVIQLGTKGVNYATSIIMQTAIKGGGGIVSQLKRSYSTSEINEESSDVNRNVKALPSKAVYEDDDHSVSSGSYESETRHRSESESSHRPRGHSTGRTVRASKARSADVSDVYFHDVPDAVPQRRSPRTHEPSNSISGTLPHQPVTRRSRTGDISAYATLPRTTSKRAAAKKRQM